MSLLTNYILIMRYNPSRLSKYRAIIKFFLIDYGVVVSLTTHSATLLDLACTTIIAR